MTEMVNMALYLHQAFILLLFALAIWNYMTLKKENREAKLIRRLELVSPQYNVNIAALGFTGIVIWTVIKFPLKIDVIIMLMGLAHMSITSIKQAKIYKKMTYGLCKAEEYFVYSKKKYMMDIIVLIVVTILAYLTR
jgi:hypothetical protein